VALDGLGVRPTLVLSGINPGNNVGALLTASGTLGAAWEAADSGIPAMAFSRADETAFLDPSALAGHVRDLVARGLRHGLPSGSAILNANFPSHVTPSTGWALTTTATGSLYGHVVVRAEEGGGRTIWDLTVKRNAPSAIEEGSDLAALLAGLVSLTFLPRRVGVLVDGWAARGTAHPSREARPSGSAKGPSTGEGDGRGA
jgi:5'-nucleotidase